jgi:toxin ParE1/3/4
MRVQTTSLARKDIIESAEFIARDNIDAAVRFLDAVEITLEMIKATPAIGRKKEIGGEHNLRMWFVKDFPKHLVFYTASKSEIRIVRIIHSSRDYRKEFPT